MSQSKTENQKPHILQNHTLKNNRAYEKYIIGGEGSNPIQICTKILTKTIRTMKIISTNKNVFYFLLQNKCGIFAKKVGWHQEYRIESMQLGLLHYGDKIKMQKDLGKLKLLLCTKPNGAQSKNKEQSPPWFT